MQVELLSRLCSPYLLALLGYCSDNSSHKLLVYEFMANGGLQEHLYPVNGKHNVSSNSFIFYFFLSKYFLVTFLFLMSYVCLGIERYNEHPLYFAIYIIWSYFIFIMWVKSLVFPLALFPLHSPPSLFLIIKFLFLSVCVFIYVWENLLNLHFFVCVLQ